MKREQDRRDREKNKDRRKAEQRNAILKAKEDLYNDFFQASQASIVSSLKVANQSAGSNPASATYNDKKQQTSETKSTFRAIDKQMNSAGKIKVDMESSGNVEFN